MKRAIKIGSAISLGSIAVLAFALSCAVSGKASRAGIFPGLPLVHPDANAERSAIPDVYKWNLSPLAKNRAEWLKEIDATKAGLKELPGKCSDLSKPQSLYSCLKAYFGLDEKINRLTLWAKLRKDVESTNPECLTDHQTGLKLTDDLLQIGSTLRQKVLALSSDYLKEAYSKVAKLKDYKPFLDELFRRKDRVLDKDGERVLSLAGDNLWAQIDLNEIPSSSESAFIGLLTDLKLPKIKDENGKEVQLTLSNYGKYRASPDRRVRKDTVEKFFKTLASFQHAFAATLAGQVKFNVFLAKARKYKTAREAYLDKDRLTPAVYDSLIKAVRKNLPALHRYVELRKKRMKLEKIHIYDLYVPMVENVEKDIPFGEAAGIVLDALKPLGKKYLSVVEKAMNPANGWVDVYPSKHKESGAFSASVYNRHPYVKINFQNRLEDVFTLAHEFGHAMHSHLAMTHQPYITFRYVPFLAEIASTFNETLLMKYLLGLAKDKKERAYLLNKQLESIRTTIYRQTMFAEFELKIHQQVEAGKALTPKTIRKIYKGLLRDYYGPSYTIDSNDDMEWAYIPHFYWKYYVFTYATGLSSAIALADRVMHKGPKARQAYLGMLKGGCSRPPLELLKSAGVDLTKPEAIQSAMDLFASTLDQLEKVLE
ncbi:MAG: oligoendopeptidase F [Deltaproteobacteria bacterium]|nr:oligoendopeptidase F [Deltaproteobacteria bacterium]